MKTWTLTIDDIVPTANVYMRTPSLRRGQRHRRGCTRHQQDLKEAWNWLLTLAIICLNNKASGITEAKRRRSVKMISYRRGEPDPQNMYLAHDKLVLDNLVKLGVLVDDNAKWCDFSVVARKAGKLGKRTVIEIREE